MVHKLVALVLVVLASTSAPASAEVRLVMFEQPGCVYCARWMREVGDAYHLTEEGQIAPLWRINIHSDYPDTIVLQQKPVYTPTFILIDENHHEVARLEGYLGEDFFWGLLQSMLLELPESGAENDEQTIDAQ
ncbi:MAG: thioredoxin fold domain-containing protein [Paracoccaceae bacterium]